MRHRALYAAFDRVPSAKGAAIHIAHAVQALERAAGNTLLACVADGRPSDAPRRYFLYFGALQPWQGVGAAPGRRAQRALARPACRG